jgi:hypothetical protein
MWSRHLEARRIQPATRIPEPLGHGHCRHLAGVVAEVGPNWSVELHDNVPGNAAIVILPEDVHDAFGAILIVHADESAFHIEEVHGNAHRKLGQHVAWDDVLRAVRIRLIWQTPFPPTRH